MRKIKVVVLLVHQLQHGFTKNAKVSPNLTVAPILPTRRSEDLGKQLRYTLYTWNVFFIIANLIIRHPMCLKKTTQVVHKKTLRRHQRLIRNAVRKELLKWSLKTCAFINVCSRKG